MVEQIREGISYYLNREKIKKYMDSLYMICFAVFLWYRAISYSSMQEVFSEYFVPVLRLIIVVVVLARFLFLSGEEQRKSEWTAAAVIATLLGIAWVYNYSSAYLELAFLLVGSVEIDYRSLVKMYIVGMGGAVLLCLMASLLGLGTDVVSVQNMSRELPYIVTHNVENYGAARYYHSLGFVNGESLARALFCLCLAVWVFERRLEGYFFSILFVMVGIFTLICTGDLRTFLLFLLAALLAATVYVMNTRKFWKTQQSMQLRKKMITGVRCFSLACIFSYPLLGLLLLILGGEDYIPALCGKGVTVFVLTLIHFLVFKKARREKNGILMVASTLPLLYSVSTFVLADPFNDIYALVLFASFSSSVEEKEEEKYRDRRSSQRYRLLEIGIGSLVLVLLFLPLVLNLASFRTMISFLGGRENMLLSVLLLTLYVLMIFEICHLVAEFLVTGRKKEGFTGRYFMLLLPMIGLFLIVQVFTVNVVKKVPENYEKYFEEEEETLTDLAKLCDDTGVVMYVSDVPAFYKRELDYVTDTIFLGNYLAKRENVILVTRAEEEYPELIHAGFYHTLISEEHAIYSNSEWAWQLLEGEGYAKSNCYSGKHSVDMEELAKRTELTYRDDGILVIGNDECIWNGTALYWPAGVYQVDVKIKWIGGSVVESAGARLALNNPSNGDFGGEVIYHGHEIRYQDETLLTTTFVQTEDGYRDIQISSYDDMRFWVEEITWQQLWETEQQ